MQNKHLGALSVSFLSISVLVSVFVFREAVSSVEIKPVPKTATDSLKIDQQQLEAIERLLPQIVELAKLLESSGQSVDLSAFGYQPTAVTHKKSKPKPTFNYRVSMVYLSADQKYCVVNGKFRSVGDDLAGGGRVRAISEKGALIRKAGISRWVAVSNPLATPAKALRPGRKKQNLPSPGLKNSIEALEYLQKLQKELKERK